MDNEERRKNHLKAMAKYEKKRKQKLVAKIASVKKNPHNQKTHKCYRCLWQNTFSGKVYCMFPTCQKENFRKTFKI